MVVSQSEKSIPVFESEKIKGHDAYSEFECLSQKDWRFLEISVAGRSFLNMLENWHLFNQQSVCVSGVAAIL